MNLVFNQDCKDMMSSYKDNHFDLACTDPPYFDGPNTRGYYGNEVNKINIKRKNYPKIESWDIPNQDFYDELCRISKHQIIFGINYFEFKGVGPGRIVWDKCNQTSSFSDAEIASCSSIKSTRLFRYMWNGMCQGKSILEGHIMQGNKKLNEERIHPTQKPIALYSWIFDKFCSKGGLILDTHVGSGSSRIAAHEYGFGFIGFEKDKTIFQKQERRFKEYVIGHPNMFKYEK